MLTVAYSSRQLKFIHYSQRNSAERLRTYYTLATVSSCCHWSDWCSLGMMVSHLPGLSWNVCFVPLAACGRDWTLGAGLRSPARHRR